MKQILFFITAILLGLSLTAAEAKAVSPCGEFLGGIDATPCIFSAESNFRAAPEASKPVALSSNLPAGSILVRTGERKLYFIEGKGRATIYTVAVGREGFAWSGTAKVTRKAEMPDWRPPAEMIKREATSGHIIPEFVKGGAHNPLGTRAIYLGSGDFRIHGTDKPWTIGQAASSGCIRMLNQDIEVLYPRVKLGATVVVQ